MLNLRLKIELSNTFNLAWQFEIAGFDFRFFYIFELWSFLIVWGSAEKLCLNPFRIGLMISAKFPFISWIIWEVINYKVLQIKVSIWGFYSMNSGKELWWAGLKAKGRGQRWEYVWILPYPSTSKICVNFDKMWIQNYSINRAETPKDFNPTLFSSASISKRCQETSIQIH